MTPSQPSTRSSSSSESSGSFYDGQPHPADDLTGYGVGQDVQLLDGCEMVNKKCKKKCFIPWKSGLCTKFEKDGTEGLRCKCRRK